MYEVFWDTLYIQVLLTSEALQAVVECHVACAIVDHDGGVLVAGSQGRSLRGTAVHVDIDELLPVAHQVKLLAADAD